MMTQPEANPRQSAPPSGKLQIVTGAKLAEFEESIRKAIAYRAYELFESRGRRDGGDMADWFSAESELVKPAGIEVEERAGQLHVRAGVSGFSRIQLGIAPDRLIIWGEAAASQGGATHMLDEINLPAPVDPNKASAMLNGETLEFHAPEVKSHAA